MIAGDGSRAVVLIDGITNTTLKRLTPDSTWSDYAGWLERRRSDLAVVHLEQPYDWLEILLGRAEDYPQLVRAMAEELVSSASPRWREIVVLGFSLGGLTALSVVHVASRLAPQFQPAYLAFVTLGAPFGGTGFVTDEMLRRLSISYLDRIYDLAATRTYFRELLAFADRGQLRIMLGRIQHDELVMRHSCLLPADWLFFTQPREALRWGTFEVPTKRLIRAHDGLLHDQIALGYIDGLVDGLLPSDGQGVAYEPFSQHR